MRAFRVEIELTLYNIGRRTGVQTLWLVLNWWAGVPLQASPAGFHSFRWLRPVAFSSVGSGFRAVVFDLDGTLLNTEDIFEQAGCQLMARRGLQMTSEIRHAMLGRRPVEAFTALKSLTGLTDSIEDMMHETKVLFRELAETSVAILPGVTELLTLAEDCGLPRAVATSSPRPWMTWLLTKVNLLDRFHFTLTAEDVTFGKPHPEIYLSAAARLGVTPAEMLVFEDSETGTRSAAAAGAFVVSVPNRHTSGGDFSVSSLRVSTLLDPLLPSLILGGHRSPNSLPCSDSSGAA
jgi:HAD superfamily hydrolase (TIGR01509 family)